MILQMNGTYPHSRQFLEEFVAEDSRKDRCIDDPCLILSINYPPHLLGHIIIDHHRGRVRKFGMRIIINLYSS